MTGTEETAGSGVVRRAEAYVDENLPRFVEELCELVRQPSVSSTGEGVAECGALLAKKMQGMGVEARVFEGRPYPFVWGKADGRPGAPTLLIYGHYDVQPPEPLAEWKSPPYDPQIRGGRIYGRGTGDNKGQFLAHLKATEFWLREMGELPVNLRFVFEGGEEVLSPGLEEFALAHRDLLEADACYVADGPMHESGRPTLFLGLGGIMILRATLKVMRRDSHSAYAAVLPNAALELSQMISRLVDRQGRVSAPGFYNGVRPPTGLEQEALRRIPPVEDAVRKEFGIEAIAGDPEATYYEKLLFRPLISLEGLQAGYMGEGHKAAVPSVARATLHIRLVADQDPEEVYRSVTGYLLEQAGGWQLEFEQLCASPPSRIPMDHPVVAPFVEAQRTVGGDDPVILPCIGTGCHANHVLVNVLGIPTVWASYAGPDQSNHAPNENLRIDHFRRGILVSAAAFQGFGRCVAGSCGQP